MIASRENLKKFLRNEKNIYCGNSVSEYLEKLITSDISLKIYKFVKLLRKTEYHHNSRGIRHKLLYVFYRKRKNKLGIKLGIEMWDNTFDEGLTIYHAGNIVINGTSKIGKNCKLHGSNCIGNDGKTLDSPVIGDNVRLGVGVKVIGGITLADDIIIGAGAVVVHSFNERGITIAGVPAKKVN